MPNYWEFFRDTLAVKKEKLLAEFHFFDGRDPLIISRPSKDGLDNNKSLELISDYGSADNAAGVPYYFWTKKAITIPPSRIARINTLAILGNGIQIQDPEPYESVVQPFVFVQDCGIGCAAKVFSKDVSVTIDDLNGIKDTQLGCDDRSLRMKQEAIIRYQLKIIGDPFCS